LKDTLLASLDDRLCHSEELKILLSATLLDPRFKERLFSKTDTLKEAKAAVVAHITETDASTSISAPEEEVSPGTILLDEEEAEEEVEEELTTSKAAETEFQLYLPEKHAARTMDPVEFWRINATRFPLLSTAARLVLCAPPTSADSERIFLAFESIVSDKRASLTCDHVETITFLNVN
ncbi:hypothetical protein CAPTEDRAFT_76446, partial [Capitella teleta]